MADERPQRRHGVLMTATWGVILAIGLGVAQAQFVDGVPTGGGSLTVTDTPTSLSSLCTTPALVQVRTGAIYFRYDPVTPTPTDFLAPTEAIITVQHPARFRAVRVGETDATLAVGCFR